jgi:hypothetical protein
MPLILYQSRDYSRYCQITQGYDYIVLDKALEVVKITDYTVPYPKGKELHNDRLEGEIYFTNDMEESFLTGNLIADSPVDGTFHLMNDDYEGLATGYAKTNEYGDLEITGGFIGTSPIIEGSKDFFIGNFYLWISKNFSECDIAIRGLEFKDYLKDIQSNISLLKVKVKNDEEKISKLEFNISSQNERISSLDSWKPTINAWKSTVTDALANISDLISSLILKTNSHEDRIVALENKTCSCQANQTTAEYLEFLSSNDRKSMVCGSAIKNNLTHKEDLGLTCDITYKPRGRPSCRCKEI